MSAGMEVDPISGANDPFFDPHALDCIGEIARCTGRRARPPIREMEASGRFRHQVGSTPTPEAMAPWFQSARAIFAGDWSSPFADQIETVMRLAESFSPGHERVQDIYFPNRALGLIFEQMIVGQRKPTIGPEDDVAQQVASPLHTKATVIGCEWDRGWRHVQVATRAEVLRVARAFLPTRPSKQVCQFCSRTRQFDDQNTKILLRGRGFRIFATPACRSCHNQLNKNAARIGVKLTWVSPKRIRRR